MQRVREQVQVPEQMHSGAWTVKSVTVAVLDTGIAYHPDLVGHLLCFPDFVEKASFRMMITDMEHHVCGILLRKRRIVRWKVSGNGTGVETCRGKSAGRTGEKDPVIPCRRLWNGSYG